ncbi:MAG: hypothetical protein J6Y43_03550, partial [Clostridia bacterium]|nr:hypothetical protein [Clostridia bacterium]
QRADRKIVLHVEGIMKRLRIIAVATAVLFAALSAACSGEVLNDKEDNGFMFENVQPLGERTNVNAALCGTDALGREIMPAGEDNGRLVGLFYTLWLGNYYSDQGESYFPSTVYDMSEMDFSYLYKGVGGSPLIKMHFYAQPLFGYYNQKDAWVVDNHVKMFIAAGIDFLGIDATNNDFYPEPLEVLLTVLDYYATAGYKVPKIMFLTNTDSADRVMQIYDYLYKDNRYKHLWFTDGDGGANPDGKPWITMKNSDKVYLSNAAFRTFYFRESQWPNEPFKPNGFPWIEFDRPQPVHNGVISVSVAQNNGMHISNSVQFENSPNGNDYYNSNRGRGYSSADNVNRKDRVNAGSNFQEQWDVAIASDARIAFVLEWNEWAALKLVANVKDLGQKVVFFDCASPEFSRDIEPISGFYGDLFYTQLIFNVRRFKGTVGAGIKADNVSATDGRIDWNAVSSGVAEFSGVKTREYYNCNNTVVYTNNTVRNDIVEIRVAADADKVYVLLTCADDVISGEDGNWMNLYVKTAAKSAATGYTFAVGRIRSGNKAEILDMVDNVKAGEASYSVSGKYVEYVLPKALLGDGFELKATDNVNLSDDVMKLYTDGDSAPYGRLNYRFNLKQKNYNNTR